MSPILFAWLCARLCRLACATGGTGFDELELWQRNFNPLYPDASSFAPPPFGVSEAIASPVFIAPGGVAAQWVGDPAVAVPALVTPICIDTPIGWLSAGGTGCDCYASQNYCTPSGGYGAGWVAEFADFDIWATNELTATQACCACGGGSARFEVPNMPSASPCDYTMVQVGPGFCGDTEEAEINNRLGGWVVSGTRELADETCKVDPTCQGYHWNNERRSYVLLGKVGDKTSGVTEDGDICYRKQLKEELAPPPAPPPPAPPANPCNSSDPEGQVTFSMRISGVDSYMKEASLAVQEAVAAEAGSSVPEGNILVAQGAGSVWQVAIPTPMEGSVRAATVASILKSSTTLARTVEDVVSDRIRLLPPDASLTAIHVSYLSEPIVEAVFCGDAAHEHLDAAYEYLDINR